MMRRFIPVLLLLALVPSVSASPDIGMNLDFFAPWSTQIGFVDAFMVSRPFIAVETGSYSWDMDVEIPSDINGYPLEVPFTVDGVEYYVASHVFTDIQGNYPAGNYTLILNGTGYFSVSGDCEEEVFESPGVYTINVTPSNTGLWMEIFESSEGDYINQIQLILPGYLDSKETNPYHPFYSPLIEGLEGFTVIRTMNAVQVNEHRPDPPIIDPASVDALHTWENRVKLGFQSQAENERGMAWEHAVDLVNQVEGADIWVNVPHAADEGYVRSLARLVSERLDADRKVYVEWSNEVWNPSPGFSQYLWYEERGALEGLTDSQFYVQGLIEIHDVFVEEIGEDRVVRVLNSQLDYFERSEELLGHMLDPEINPDGRKVEAFAVGAYFGLTRVQPGDSPTVEELLVHAGNDINVTIIPSLIETRRILEDYNKLVNASAEVVAYEGGQHLTPMDMNFGYIFDDDIMEPFITANQDPTMYDLFTDWLNGWFDNGGGTLIVFSYVTQPETTGVFGVMEYFGQPIEEAHKMRAIRDYMQPEELEEPEESTPVDVDEPEVEIEVTETVLEVEEIVPEEPIEETNYYPLFIVLAVIAFTVFRSKKTRV